MSTGDEDEAGANAAAMDEILGEAEAAAARRREREARIVRLRPEGEDCAGWPLGRDRFGDSLGLLRAPYPPDLHPRAVAGFSKWAEDADRRLDNRTLDAVGARAEYAAALSAAIRQSDEAAAADREREAADREAFIEAAVPPLYRTPIDRARLRNPRAFDTVAAWRPGGACPGLLCAGDTGMGKTRAVFARLMELHRAEGLPFVALSSDALKQRMIDLSQRGGWDDEAAERAENLARSARARDFLPARDDTLGLFCAKLQTVPVLFVDDLSQIKATGFAAEKLFSIIENRTREGLPLIVTLQTGPADLIRKLAGAGAEYADTAACLVRRLQDFCEAVDFGFGADAGVL
jgi:hypothetical protein